MAWDIRREIFGRADSFDDITRAFSWKVPKRLNLGELCDHQPEGWEALIVVERENSFTFGEIASLSNSFAGFLIEAGLVNGDRVGVMLHQSLEAAVVHLGVLKAGCISVPLSPLLGSDALSYRIRHSETKVFVADGVSLKKLSNSNFKPILTVGVGVRADHEIYDVTKAGSGNFDSVETMPTDPAILIYTSGTTSYPRGALLPHSTLLGRIPGFLLAHHPFPPEEGRFWSPAEWSWVAGLLDSLFCPWSFGFPVVTSTIGKFDPEMAFELIEKHRVSHACVAPTALRIMAKSNHESNHDISSLKSIHSGGEPLTLDAFNWAKDELGIEVREIYGLTEASFLIGNSSLFRVKPGSMGKPYPGHKVEILGKKGEPLPPGKLGEIGAERDPVMFLGYWRDEQSTKIRQRGKWFMTGDLAIKDPDGYFWFKGRSDDMIKISGRRISPVEVEACLLSHPLVEDAAVVSVPDQLRGNAMVAFVKLKDGSRPSPDLEEDLKRLTKTRLSEYEYPKKIEFLEELSKTITGKVMRRELRKRARFLGM